MDFDPDCAPPGETVFQSAPGQLAHLAAANATQIAQHIAEHEEKEYDPVEGRMVFKHDRGSDRGRNQHERYDREPEGDESNTAQGYNLHTNDEDGFKKPKLLPPGLQTEEFITPTEETEDLEKTGYIAFQKKKLFDNEFQERADRVRRLHAPRFGKYYKDPDRPIYASEIKSWFHAWLGKQHLAAHYDYESSMSLTEDGMQQYMYTVECTVTGFKHTSRARMACKKDCQTAATWLFIDWMILNNHIDPRIIPFEKEDIYVDVKHINLENEEENKRSIYTKKMRFVSAGKLSSDGSEEFIAGDPNKRRVWEHSAPSDVERAQKVVEQIFGGKSKPVGMEYVEFLHGSGKNRFHCRLCDVEVTDESGKAMHVRGRKHKLNYKRFVDPDLGIGKLSAEEEKILKADVLEYQKTLALEHKNKATALEARDMELTHHEQLEEFCYQVYEDFDPKERDELAETLEKEDRKLEFRCPSLKHIYAHACKFEKPELDNLCRKKLALLDEFKPVDAKAMSEVQQFENALIETFKLVDAENPNASWMSWPHPVRRIGSYVKGYPVEGDKDGMIQFVVICARHPTRELVQGIVEKLRVKLDPRESTVGLVKVQPNTFSVNYARKYHLPVFFTSKKLFNKTAVIPRYYGTPLERDQCIRHLMEVERKTFFKRYMSTMPNYMETLKLMSDICSRSDSWNNLKGWPLEVIVNNAISSALNASAWPSSHGGGSYDGVAMQPQNLTLYRNLKRVFEYVASGTLYLYGLLDPVELVKIERQILKKLVGYDEDDVVTMEDDGAEEYPHLTTATTKEDKKIMEDNLREEVIVESQKQFAKDFRTDGAKNMGLSDSVVPKTLNGDGEEKAWSDEEKKPEAKTEVKEEAKPKRKRKSKFGKKAEDVAEVKTVTVVKKGDTPANTEAKRPKMMAFVKASETGAAQSDDEEPEEITPGQPDKPSTQDNADPTVKVYGKHIDLISSLRPQHLEDVTASSHTVLRMLNFGLTHKVLGVRADIITSVELEELRQEELRKKQARQKVVLPDTKGMDFNKD